MRSALGLGFLAIALVSVLLLISNLGLRLPVYFLTLQTRPQPLGLWLVLAIAAGLLTSAILHLCLGWLASPAGAAPANATAANATEPRSRRRGDWTFMGREAGGQQQRRNSTAADAPEPWETAGWSARTSAEATPPPRSPRPEASASPPAERVIDTGFRVIKPPTSAAAEPSPNRRTNAAPPSATSTEDDWDFVEKDDW
ncbi:hypothetical protein [Synechococcus elongatus]|uniref:Uncharacterized protein n=2 Tax=Synechococcus elongatus TaxID=32046 RepID=Q31LY0_SYNE7|nr:hypothetical protein [Synechococcus elongatus]ABB57939.1 conserved hypothetical protein [Synechococcus elongatus PCC 7942 = FACHB-805]AJD57581.1 hypothetical protein M744_06890 [Synechococcus elongatus UTEX 2973]MBD2586656.1 hypothetical protein [Synechococcus elongatus FACHB-242]MBD2687730.1 hypothetical protein [Synechococcus elongatus FACHB-1061]MBD2706560.1 hypothetical protein [Synechococcus elongatus PCC 7942 = FACHB-805]